MSARQKLRARPRLAMTLRQHLSTVKASCLRCMEVEDKLVERTWDDSIHGLPEAAAVAAEALKQMNCAYVHYLTRLARGCGQSR